MSDHFAAFSFVDRITTHEPGTRARGRFAIPPGLEAFPACLVAEAVGQLAAWVAMAHNDYGVRPVAAIAPETRFLREVRPGEQLDLMVEIDSCDDTAVAYSGTAEVGSERVLELIDCLGPMLPAADFDDPAALAERFRLLTTGAGAVPGRFAGIRVPRVDRDTGEAGLWTQGRLRVPAQAPFFNDHFPRRHVFPATLLLDAQIALALALVAESARWPARLRLVPKRIERVKVRDFTPPGAELVIGAHLQAEDGPHATVLLTAANGERQFATAKLLIGPEGEA